MSDQEWNRLEQGEMLALKVNRINIGLLIKNEQAFAFKDKCPHAGAQLSQGWINEEAELVCPFHRYCFNLENGRNEKEGYAIYKYETRLKKKQIEVLI